MKKIIYTQRIEIVESYGERRDCADVEIAKLIWECGFIPVPVNNIPEKVQIFLEQTEPDGLILTGGNDLSKYGGNAPERDETEKRIIEYCIKNKVPIYGFCRGMQMIADYFGAELMKVEKHVAIRHRLEGNALWTGRTVNSFHNMAVKSATNDLIIEARSEDGVIEAFKVKDKKIYGTMWHPERERPYVKDDIQFIKQIFSKEGIINMKAIILAAGQGTRLKKYTENLPKGMLEFDGKTIIERQIEIYRKCGISDIIVVRGFAADKITYPDVKYYENVDYANTNMVESLMAAKQEFDDDIIVSYSDILFEESMLKGIMESRDDFAVAVDENWQEYWQARYGKVDFDTESLSLDENNNITELGLEAPKLKDIDARYIGLLKFSKKGLEKMMEIFDRDYEAYQDKPWKQSGKTIRKAYMTDLLQAVIESGKHVKAVKFRNGWIEFDTNEDYETAVKWAENGMLERFIRL